MLYRIMNIYKDKYFGSSYLADPELIALRLKSVMSSSDPRHLALFAFCGVVVGAVLIFLVSSSSLTFSEEVGEVD